MVKSENIPSSFLSITREDLLNFLDIIRVLQRYYAMNQNNKNSESYLFRETLLNTPIEKIEIKIKKFGIYEFMISATIKDSITDSWVHVDGIAMERETLKIKGITEHPVFVIACLSDIWKNIGGRN